ncbi:MAG: hypothetical protein Q9212_002922 [Teloschistes hypoglaucus]
MENIQRHEKPTEARYKETDVNDVDEGGGRVDAVPLGAVPVPGRDDRVEEVFGGHPPWHEVTIIVEVVNDV